MTASTLIPFVDLKAQYDDIREEIDAAIASVIADTAFIGGPYVEDFEAAFAEFCAVDHAIGCSSGTDALRLALLACGVGPGDEVIVPPNTFIATAEAVTMLGAEVRFVDVDANSGNMDPHRLIDAISARTRAIIPVHLYGRPADMTPILDIARERGLRVIGDAAQAHGASCGGVPIGELGDAVCFSFYPGKNLGAYGDAGAVVTTDAEIARRVRLLRDHGRSTKYEHELVGLNCRMDGLQAAILNAKLPHLEAWTQARIRNARHYDRLLGDSPAATTPENDPASRCVYHLYVIRTDLDREALRSTLQSRGISSGIHYPIPLHLQPAYRHLGHEAGDFPVAERLSGQVLSLPMYPELTDEQIEYVSTCLLTAMDDSRSMANA